MSGRCGGCWDACDYCIISGFITFFKFGTRISLTFNKEQMDVAVGLIGDAYAADKESECPYLVICAFVK
jgi:hypothetical protein